MSQPSHLKRAYALTSVEEARALYDEWAATFDRDMAAEAEDYVAPKIAAEYVLRNLHSSSSPSSSSPPKENVEILDAGCGTGLVGIHLSQIVKTKNIDGIDLSPGMLEIARKTGAYRALATVDLSGPLAQTEDASYDVVVCVGTLTQGHVGPRALGEFVRITRRQGLVVATVLDDVWEDGGYAAEVADLESRGSVEIVSATAEDSRRAEGTKVKMVVLKVL